MKSIYKYTIVFVVVFFVTVLSNELLGQCPMCRMTAESNLANGGVDGAGLNAGILFLLATPYLIIGFLAYNWWRNKKSQEELDAEETLDKGL